MKLKIFHIALLLSLSALFSSGCAPLKLYQYQAQPKSITILDELNTFKTQANLEAKYRFYPGKLKLNLTLLSDSKNRLRLRIHQPGYPQLLADIVKPSEQVFVLLPQINQLFLGTESDLKKSNSIFANIDLNLLPIILTPLHTFSKQFNELKESKRSIKRRRSSYTFIDEKHIYKWTFNSENLKIEQLIIYDLDGKKLIKAKYPETYLSNTKSIPGKIEIRYYSSGVKLSLSLSETLLNPPLKEAVFQMRPRTNPDILPIEQLVLN